jgi:23S ribosomal protein
MDNRSNQKIEDYKDLIVWQRSMELAEEVYRLVKKLPKEELFALSDQIRRAVISIPSNIAEGYERNSTKEYIHFLSIAKGSKAELETQLLLCTKIHYLNNSDIEKSISLIQEIGKMIHSLQNLNSNPYSLNPIP